MSQREELPTPRVSLSFSVYLGLSLQIAKDLWPRRREAVADKLIEQAIALGADFASWPERPPADVNVRTGKIRAVMDLHEQSTAFLRGDR